jgi:hypothetical protein
MTRLVRRRLLAALPLLGALTLAACAPAPIAANRPPDIRGTIASLRAVPARGTASAGDPSRPVSNLDPTPTPAPAAGSPEYVLLVEGSPTEGTTYDRASVRVTAQTIVAQGDEQQRQPATAADLAVGQRVAIWFTGPVAESYPVQATAGEVVILS